MVKLLLLLFMVFLTLLSLGGCLFLSQKITDGQKKIANGKKKISQGEIAFEAGKAELKAGKLESSEGKKEYEKAEDNLFLVFADKVFNSGRGYKAGRARIAAGDKEIALGVEDVNEGEKRLNAGKRELLEGIEQVELAKGARIACGLGVVFFALVTLALGICWRRELGRLISHPPTQ